MHDGIDVRRIQLDLDNLAGGRSQPEVRTDTALTPEMVALIAHQVVEQTMYQKSVDQNAVRPPQTTINVGAEGTPERSGSSRAVAVVGSFVALVVGAGAGAVGWNYYDTNDRSVEAAAEDFRDDVLDYLEDKGIYDGGTGLGAGGGGGVPRAQFARPATSELDGMPDRDCVDVGRARACYAYEGGTDLQGSLPIQVNRVQVNMYYGDDLVTDTDDALELHYRALASPEFGDRLNDALCKITGNDVGYPTVFVYENDGEPQHWGIVGERGGCNG